MVDIHMGKKKRKLSKGSSFGAYKDAEGKILYSFWIPDLDQYLSRYDLGDLEEVEMDPAMFIHRDLFKDGDPLDHLKRLRRVMLRERDRSIAVFRLPRHVVRCVHREYDILDGWHRCVAAWLKGNPKINAIIYPTPAHRNDVLEIIALVKKKNAQHKNNHRDV